MTPRERTLAALRLEQPDKIPFIDYVSPETVTAVCKRKGQREDLNPAEFAKLIGMDAIPMDDYLAPFFSIFAPHEGGREYIKDGMIKTENDLDKMVFPDYKKPGFFDAAKRFVDDYGKEDLALFAGFRTGMTNIMLSMGLPAFAKALHRNPKMLETMADRYTEWNCEVVGTIQSLGFDFLFDFDDIAFNSGCFFKPSLVKEFFIPRLKPLLDMIKLPWVYHSDGDLTNVMDYLVEMGMNGIMSLQPDVMDINAIKAKYGDRIAVWGNIDLHYTLTMGSVEETVTEVKKRMREVGPGGGYIISSSNALTEYCLVDNVMAMIDTIEKYRDYPINIPD